NFLAARSSDKHQMDEECDLVRRIVDLDAGDGLVAPSLRGHCRFQLHRLELAKSSQIRGVALGQPIKVLGELLASGIAKLELDEESRCDVFRHLDGKRLLVRTGRNVELRLLLPAESRI